MAITSSGGGSGIVVNSAAKDSRLLAATLGSQAAAAADEVIVPNAIGTNNQGNLMASPSYVGRLIMIRPSKRDEEIRFITADASNTLTVHEPWDTPPVSGDDWCLSYIIQDVATVTGFGLLTKRVSDYSTSRRVSIGFSQGSTSEQPQFAWLAFLEGISLETNDNSSSTTADFSVILHGYFTNGYRSGGKGVSGGYMIGTPAVDGEMALSIDAEDGGRVDLYDFFLTHVKSNLTRLHGPIRLEDGKIFAGSNDIFISGVDGTTGSTASPSPLGYNQYINTTIEGRGGATETVFVDHFTRTDGLTLISTNGLEHEYQGTVNRSWEVVLEKVTFVQNTQLIGVRDANQYHMVDPVWTVNDLAQDDINFIETTDNPRVYEEYELVTTVTEPDGTTLPEATVYVLENFLDLDVVNTGVTDADGKDNSRILKRRYEHRAAATSVGPIITPNGFDFNDGGGGNDSIDRNDGGSWITDGYELDGPITIASATVAANNGTRRILGITAGTLEVATGSLTADTDDNTAIASAAVSVNRNLRDTFSLRIYSYGRSSFVAPLTDLDGEGFPGSVPSVSVSLPVDPAVSAATLALALSNPTTDPVFSRHGPGETDTQPLKVIAYDAGTGGLPTEGEVITIDNAGADTTGNLVEIIGDAVSGVMVLENWNGTEPENNVNATGGTSTFDVTTDTTGGGGSFNEEYTILVDCNDETLQTTYDFERGVMAKPGKLSDYKVSRQVNARVLHRSAANEWYAVLLDKRGRVQVLKSTQDFGTNLLSDVDWTPVDSPMFVLDHFADGRAHRDDGVPFGMWSELDGTTLHIMTTTFAGVTSYHTFNTSTDVWAIQNEFVALPWDFLPSFDSRFDTDNQYGLSNRDQAGADFFGDGSQGVSFSIRSDGDVVAMVPARTRPDDGATGLDHRCHFQLMTREAGVWTARGDVTGSVNQFSVSAPCVLMDSSDLATCIWGTGNGGTDDIVGRTINSSNSFGTEFNIDTTADPDPAANADPWRIGRGIITSGNNIYVPYVDADDDITVATWASAASSPTITLRTGLNNGQVNRRSEFSWPFNNYDCVDDGTTVQLVYVDTNQDTRLEPNVDSAGADTTLQSTDTARQTHSEWDSDTSEVVYLQEYTPELSVDERNIRNLKVRRDTNDMINGVLLDARNLILNWGQAEHAHLLKFGADGYFTDRNVANTEGVWVANRGAGAVDFMTSDDGTTFTPPVTISLTFSGLRDNTEIRICDDVTGLELAGIENATDGSADNRSWTVALTAGTVVDIRFAHGIAADGNVYTVPDRNSILNFTWPAATTTLPITQVLDRTFSDPV